MQELLVQRKVRFAMTRARQTPWAGSSDIFRTAANLTISSRVAVVVQLYFELSDPLQIGGICPSAS